MKRLFAILMLSVTLLLAVLLIRTLLLESRQIAPGAGAPADLDRMELAQQLAAALTFPTISSRDATLEDNDAFLGLHAHLARSFPRVHRSLSRELLDDRHLLYTWPGSDPSLKPVLLTGHIDVVPVEPGTEQDWQVPPFAGRIADGYIWGRGAMDNKSAVVGLLAAAEELLAQGHRPRHTLYLAFGADEEVGGHRGAKGLAAHLERQGIRLGFVLDEGGAVTHGVVRDMDRPVALVGIAEKGYVSVELIARAEGGHSSMPPAQSAIGILGRAVERLEARQMPARLSAPLHQMLGWLGPEMPAARRLIVANLWLFGGMVMDRLSATDSNRAALHTTTAITMIDGGTAENVLPRQARAVVNFRILPGDTIADVLAHAEATVNDPRISLRALPDPQEASAVSDVDGDSFALLHRTIRDVFPDAVVAPYLVLGATDSRHYARLADNVYRFQPLRLDSADLPRLHGVNERISVEVLASSAQFYALLMQRL